MSGLVCVPPSAHRFSHILKTDSLFRRFLQETTEILDVSESNFETENNIAELIANFELIANLANHAVEQHINVGDDIISSIQGWMDNASDIIDNHLQYGIGQKTYYHLKDIYRQISISMSTIIIQKDTELYQIVNSGNPHA